MSLFNATVQALSCHLIKQFAPQLGSWQIPFASIIKQWLAILWSSQST